MNNIILSPELKSKKVNSDFTKMKLKVVIFLFSIFSFLSFLFTVSYKGNEMPFWLDNKCAYRTRNNWFALFLILAFVFLFVYFFFCFKKSKATILLPISLIFLAIAQCFTSVFEYFVSNITIAIVLVALLIIGALTSYLHKLTTIIPLSLCSVYYTVLIILLMVQDSADFPYPPYGESAAFHHAMIAELFSFIILLLSLLIFFIANKIPPLFSKTNKNDKQDLFTEKELNLLTHLDKNGKSDVQEQSAETKLNLLNQLLNKGLITQEEYDKKVADIISKL